MSRGYFVTGTDTGVGKTLVSAALLHAHARQGLRVVGMKPIASGCEWHNGVACWEDVAQLEAAGNLTVPLDQRNPYRFDAAVAPHIAAAEVGQKIEIGTICQAYAALQRAADVVIVEGAGGFLVPLNEVETLADLAQALGLPVILVVGIRLGCINHALLTVQAVARMNLPLAGWVANQLDPDMLSMQETLTSLQQRIAAPLLGLIPYQPGINALDASKQLHIDRLSL